MIVTTITSINNKLQQPEAAAGVLEYAMKHFGELASLLSVCVYSINNKLQQPEAAAGVLEYAMKHFGELSSLLSVCVYSINNKLQQPEAAAGVLEYAMKHFGELEIQATWYEKLHEWEDALVAYDKKIDMNKEDPELMLGRMRCLEALGEWGQLHQQCCEEWALVSEDTQAKMARMAAAAAWGLGHWDSMEEYTCMIPRDTHDGAFYRAVLALHQDLFSLAQQCIDKARDLLDAELTAMAGESYSRAYGAMVSCQMLSELEEVIQYKLVPERREIIRETWWERLQGCQRMVEDWQRILMVRSLVINPHEDMRTWLKYASLCGRSGRLALAQKTLVLLLGVDPSKQLDHPLPTVHPHVTYAYMKHMWKSSRKVGLTAGAVHFTGHWDSMEEYTCMIPRDTHDGAFYRAVLALHQDLFSLAQQCIDKARDLLDAELTAMAGESYSRAYGAMVSCQMLSELEEVIQYKLVPERREIIRETWWERLQGCQRIVEDWQRILMVRSLVINPHEDMRTWLKYASLCGRSGRLALAHKTLVLLLGVDPSKQLDHPLPTVHPHVTYAYMKHMWKSARKITLSPLKPKKTVVFNTINALTRPLISPCPDLILAANASALALLLGVNMAASREAAVGAKEESISVENDESTSEITEVFPGFKDADSFVKYGLGTVVAATKASANLPQSGDEHDFYRSFPGFQGFCETQGERLLQCMSRVMQYHGCRSHMRDRNKVTGLEDRFDLLVDSNDVILENVGILLDEASGVNRKQPILPAGVQPPKTIVSSWNRKGGALSKRNQSETFRLLHAKNIQRPQMKFREKVDNANTPFVPKIFAKPNALKPLPAGFHTHISMNWTSLPQMRNCFPNLNPKLMYKPLQETNCHLVTTLEELVELNEKLAHCSEFAVDLEHHSYRSFLGLTCLMQISTRDEDFIIDTLELRSEMYILNETFTDPSIVKVFHGADSDIEWLQRDFGLYVVNLFDTHQAARLLNLGRNSLEHLMKLFCSVEADKQYQLADWRIRPLPEEMLNYARDDTHYLLYIYDKMRAELYEKGNALPALLQVAWQKSKDVCLKKYIKPIFTDDSYQDLYRKQKKPLDTQQLTAFRLLYAWRDQISRQEDESTGEPQGIIACCNPVPPLVRQQVNELHLLVQQAREMPLLKTEVQTTEKKKATTLKRKSENPLFGPHDSSHISESEIPNSHSSAPLLKRGKLFSEDEEMEEGKEVQDCSPFIARATITIFDFELDVKEENHLTVAQQKSHRIMQSFENPFRMYLPSKETNIHMPCNAKYDPSSKVYEISNRWKLLSQELQQKEAKEKEAAKKKAKEAAQKATDERKKAQEEYKTAAQSIVTVRQQAAIATADQKGKKKKDRTVSEPGAETPKPEKKRPKHTEQPADQAPATDFQPFDYSKSDFKVFAGRKSKESSQFDPAKQAQEPKQSKKNSKAHKNNSTPGNKSMSYLAGKSDSETYGNVLVLDGVIQCTERDEFSYQEMIANLPLCSHPNPKKVLIIGGGDGGVLREVVKHPLVESVVQCEIDEDVINVSKKYLPGMAKGFFSPKLTLNVGDGFEFMKQNQVAFDVIITDSSDPVGPAESLFKESYYQLMKTALRDNGILCCQGECQWLHLELIKEMRTFCKSLFPVVDYAYCTIPTYPSGQIGFMLCSKNTETNFRDPVRKLTDEEVESMNLKYYNYEIHRAAFILPEFARKVLSEA
ncbi:UNVERIFIED_CONTAM: hypothetical protein FKN15_060862 [Acipenser sinensis]